MRVLANIVVILLSLMIKANAQARCEEGRTISINEKGDTIITYAEKSAYLKDGVDAFMKRIINGDILTRGRTRFYYGNQGVSLNKTTGQIGFYFVQHADGSTDETFF